MPVPPKVRRARAYLGGHVRANHPPEVIEAARNELQMANAEAAVRKIVDAALPLTPTQLDRLALMLRPAGDSDGPAT